MVPIQILTAAMVRSNSSRLSQSSVRIPLGNDSMSACHWRQKIRMGSSSVSSEARSTLFSGQEAGGLTRLRALAVRPVMLQPVEPLLGDAGARKI